MVDIFKLKIGDVVKMPVYPKVRTAFLETGRVVYIHPEKRFFTVEFTTETGSHFRESYSPYGPLGCSEKKERPGEYGEETTSFAS